MPLVSYGSRRRRSSSLIGNSNDGTYVGWMMVIIIEEDLQ